MADNLTLDDLTSLGIGSAITALNENFTAVENEFDKVLYKDGREELTDNLDLNNNRLINVKDGIADNDAATIGQLNSLPQGPPGDPGGNVMAIGLFTAASGMSIGAGTTLVQTSGYYSTGVGSAVYVYDVAVDATFVTNNPRWSFLDASNRGFRLDNSQGVWFDQFGTDPVTSRASDSLLKTAAASKNLAAWQAMRNYMQTYKTDVTQGPTGLGQDYLIGGTPVLYINQGNYWFGGSEISIAELQHNIYGMGNGDTYCRGAATKFQWDGTCDGLVVYDNQASYPIPNNTGFHGYPSNSVIEGICFDGGGGNIFNDVTGANARVGLWIRVNGVKVKNCSFKDWGCAGVVIGYKPNASIAQGPNLCFVEFCNFWLCGWAGYYARGADSNAGGTKGCSFIDCGYYGLYDSSFLANGGHYDHHARGIGTASAGTSTQKIQSTVTPIVYYNQWYWYCCKGQATAASTTQPGTNEQVWAPLLGPYATPHPEMGSVAWVSGMTVHDTACFVSDGLNAPTTFINCYNEGDCAGMYLAPPATVIGGLNSFQPNTAGAYIKNNGGNFVVQGPRGLGSQWDKYSSGYSNGTVPVRTVSILVGANRLNDDLLNLTDTTYFPNSSRVRLSTDGKDIVEWDYANTETTAAGIYTGPSTARTFGALVARPYHRHIPKLVVGSTPRRIEVGTAAPTTGDWAVGDVCLNANYTTGGIHCWVCVAAGTPGTWSSFGAEAANADMWTGSSSSVLATPKAIANAQSPVSLVDGANIAVDLNTGQNFTLLIGGNRTLDNPTNMKVGQRGCITIIQDATGSRTLAYGSNWRFAGGAAVGGVLSTTANAVDVLEYYVAASNKIYGWLAKDFKA